MQSSGIEQARIALHDEAGLAPFAAVGCSKMRYKTGSYVDVTGWNGAVGVAKKSDNVTFGIALEHGKGNYDSYLDNGIHAEGDIKSTGGVLFGEMKQEGGVHFDTALHAGKVKSDYQSTTTSYDESSTYYGFSLGGGQVDFDAVNSQRIRLGGRYTVEMNDKGAAYAGAAWQYEFGGDAKATINSHEAPSPSIKGHSAIIEAGYKLNASKKLVLDFNLNDAFGKQRGFGGAVGTQWLF